MALKDLFKFRDDPDSGVVKPFLDHVEDLRWMVVKMALALGAGMAGCFGFRMQLVRIVQGPLAGVDEKLVANLQSLGVADSMTISLQLAFYGGIVIAFPALLYFLAEFVLPALTGREKRILLPAFVAGFGLFLGGVAFSYFVVLPQALAFFFQDAQALQWNPTWTVREYYSFVTQFTIAFGLSFELPLVILVLVKLGIVDRAQLAAARPYAVVIIFIFAAVITPTQDMITLLCMGGPMVLLYELCIWISAWMGKNKSLGNEPPGTP